MKASKLDTNLHDDLRLGIADLIRKGKNSDDSMNGIDERKRQVSRIETCGEYLGIRETQAIADAADMWIAVLSQNPVERAKVEDLQR